MFDGFVNAVFAPLFQLLKDVLCWFISLIIKMVTFFLDLIFNFMPEIEINSGFLTTLETTENFLILLNWVFPVDYGLIIAGIMLPMIFAFSIIIPFSKILVGITP